MLRFQAGNACCPGRDKLSIGKLQRRLAAIIAAKRQELLRQAEKSRRGRRKGRQMRRKAHEVCRPGRDTAVRRKKAAELQRI